MKILWLVLALLLTMTSVRAAEPAGLDMSEPPFWLSSYDEFKDLSKEQKAFYLGKLGPALEQIPSLKSMKKDQLLGASKNEEAWSELRKKVYASCKDKSVIKTCENFSAIRVHALELGSPRKK